MKHAAVVFTVAVLSTSALAQGRMCITECMYKGLGSEYVEFTNLGNASVDMTGWSFDDNSRAPGSQMLSAFGIVLPGQSVILSEAPEANMRSTWSLPASVLIIGGNANNLGAEDEVNLFDDTGSLVDRLSYGRIAFPGSIVTDKISGSPICGTFEGANDVYGWQSAALGDAQGSVSGSSGDVGNPGTYVSLTCPPPSPIAYCTAKINSQGCSPTIGSIGTPSATATSGFLLSASQELNNKVGLVLYSEFGRDASPFGPGGTLCVKAPTRRSKGFNSAGSPAPTADCSGVFSIDFNAFGRGLLGTPPNPAAYLSLPGQVVTAQFWGRDPGIAAPNNFSLSNGLEFVVGP